MKGKFLRKIISLCLISSTVICAAPEKASAAWISNYNGGWAYNDGYYLVTGWKYIDGVWYYFDYTGKMQTGWINDFGKYYYLDGNGAMQTGVIQIEGKVYLFSQSGELVQGMAVVDGKEYNFADNGACVGLDVPTPKKAFDYYGIETTPFVPNQIMNTNAEISNKLPWDGNEAKVQYKVTYKDDDGEILSVRKINADDKITLYKPLKDGYRFIEWNTKIDGEGKSYDADEKLKLTENITLYAQWDEKIDNDLVEEEKNEVTSIKIKVAGVKDDETARVDFTLNKKIQLSAIVLPGNATNRKVNWSVKSSTDDEKAIIASNGILTLKAPGTITVVATAQDGSGIVGKRQIIIQ